MGGDWAEDVGVNGSGSGGGGDSPVPSGSHEPPMWAPVWDEGAASLHRGASLWTDSDQRLLCNDSAFAS